MNINKKQIVLVAVTGLVLLALASLGWWLVSNKNELAGAIESNSEKATESKAELKVFSNKVEILVPGESEWKDGLDGAVIVAGTKVRTSKTGRGEIRLPGGSVTRIDHDSEISIEILDAEEANFLINLTKGKIWSRVSRILGRVSYETRTGRTVATVRGTEYGHETYEDFDRVVVTESKVDVKCVGDNPDSMIVDVQISDWNCDGEDPVVSLSTIKELIEQDEWYRFNLEIDENEDGEEPINILGVTDENSYVPTPKPIVNNLIDCVGPDGKTARSTKEDCEKLWDYWNDNPPPAAPKSEGGGSPTKTVSPTNLPTPTVLPSPSPTPIPINITGATCLNDGCFKLAVMGSGFGAGIRLIAKDSAVPLVATEGTVNVLDGSNMEVDYGTAYSLCYSGQQPYDLSAFYTLGNEVVFSGFVPDFCSIFN